MTKLYTKTFTHKGQMVNYYNKVRKNPKVDLCWCGLFAETGYTVQWIYKDKDKH